ncbi:hypothetical protein VB713_00305 [Anabaena cylindrica UHCC 0172]|uniref:hypothetical protein n=1 Tax=Anabaena cylindrica TaxID=1165 RepID=UPI002B1F38FA|nr:hypothetical protein [Anabaena cylindrica]MEA5549434.1 hypothetical protein [Anabaena cylindrica UHCC 0172]
MIKSLTFKTTIILTLTLMMGGLSNVQTNAQTNVQEIYIDKNCQQNQQLEEFDRFTVVYKSELKIKGQTYWFYSGQYIDASPIVCISRPGFKQAKLLNIQQIQSGYIDKISKDPRYKTAFLVTVHEGNGSYVPIIQYRLNFSTPDKPVITKLRSWNSGR